MTVTEAMRARVQQRKWTLRSIYGFAESTARKKAGHIEKWLARMKTEGIVIRFNHKGIPKTVHATLVGHEDLHDQSPRNKFIRFYDERAKKNG